MLRIALAAALVILVVAVAAIGVGGWQMNRTIGELGDTLATMNETQRALLESREKEDRPLAIRGRLFLGDKSKPASYASVSVYGLGVGIRQDQLIARLTADADGRFGSGALQPGNYSLLANLLPEKADLDRDSLLRPNSYFIQSRPISVYPWSKDADVEIDIAMVPYGQVSFELTKPLPQEIQVEFGELKRQLNIYPALGIAIPANSHHLPILRLDDSRQIDWPVVGLVGRRENDHEVFVMKPPSDIVYPYSEQFRNVEISNPVVFRRNPDHIRGDVFRTGKFPVAAYVTFGYAMMSGAGLPPLQLIGESNFATLPEASRAEIEVVESRRTHLRITPPDYFETALREEIAKTLGDMDKLAAEQQKPRPVQLEVVGQTDMVEPEKLEFPWVAYGPSGYGSPPGRASYGGAR